MLAPFVGDWVNDFGCCFGKDVLFSQGQFEAGAIQFGIVGREDLFLNTKRCFFEVGFLGGFGEGEGELLEGGEGDHGKGLGEGSRESANENRGWRLMGSRSDAKPQRNL